MRREKRDKYSTEYESDELRLKLEKGIRLKVNLKDNLEVGVLLAKFRQARLGSSRELGKVFRRSPSTVINKDRYNRMGSERLIDGRGQKKRYKIEEIRGEILYRWIKDPMAGDSEILAGIQPRLNSLGIRLDLKTLKRYIKDAGIDEVRSRLRSEKELKDEDKAENSEDSDDKEIVQTYSRYAGHMLHLPQVNQMNFSEMMEVLTEPEGRIYSKERIGLILYLFYAIGGKRLNGLDYVDHVGLGALIGMRDNIRSSGMNKRVAKLARHKIIEIIQKKALSGRVRYINKKDLELTYTDTHVIEVWVNKYIPMARHGTKNKQVKAINVHYLIGSETGVPLAKEYSSGNKRLHWSIPHLIKMAEEVLGRKIRNICFDKGGISLNTLKGLIKEGKGFISWGKRTEYVKKQIRRVRDCRFKYRRKKEVRYNGELKEIEEKIADTTTELKGLGKVRTIVVQLPEIEGGERLWIYTNLKRSNYGPTEIREMMRYKQRQEVFFKVRKNKTALDCFAGGRCRVKPIGRPGKKILELLRKQLKRLERKIAEDRENLSGVKELRAHGVLKADLAKREAEYLRRRIEQNIEQKGKTEEKIRWAEGGDRPEFIQQRYELELEKQKFLNEFQDIAFLSKRESLKEFINCYKEVLEKGGFDSEEIRQRMKYLDKASIERELFNLGGIISCDKREKKVTVMIMPQGREYFRKALEIFLHEQDKKKIIVQYSSKEKYQIHFCLAPSPPISVN